MLYHFVVSLLGIIMSSLEQLCMNVGLRRVNEGTANDLTKSGS